jgi:hypothetical protein
MKDSLPSRSSLPRLLLLTAIAALTFFVIIPAFLIWWPPASVERHSQRAKLAERVQAAGGWEAVRRDCIAFAAQNTNGFYSHWRDTNLPPAILALKPMIVEYAPKVGCVSMRVFGINSTGGHSTPYFGLEVVTSTNRADYKHGGQHSVAKQVADGIYEVY